MNNPELTTDEIREIAIRNTGQMHSNDWMAYRYGKLTSSMFLRAISVMRNLHPNKVQTLREELYVKKNLHLVRGFIWGVDHESMEIDADQNKTESIM